MKKIICIVCLLAVSVGLLASCGKAQEKNDVATAQETNDAASAQKAYELLEQAEEICINGMDDIYNAWRFGIYEADDCYTSTIFYKLSLETSFSSSELEENGGFSASSLVSGDDNWQYCLWAVKNCLKNRGDFDEVDRLLAESKIAIQSISSDYEYYSAFKEYYAKVASYAEFFKETTGSFNQLVDTISDYENDIRTAKEIFKFDFEA